MADQDSNISELTRQLIIETKFKNLILKLGERGIFSHSNSGKKAFSFSVPSFTNRVEDSVGAGDALLSYATLSMVKTRALVISSILGSIAAACECERNGNLVITPEQIIKKTNLIEESSSYKIK